MRKWWTHFPGRPDLKQLVCVLFGLLCSVISSIISWPLALCFCLPSGISWLHFFCSFLNRIPSSCVLCTFPGCSCIRPHFHYELKENAFWGNRIWEKVHSALATPKQSGQTFTLTHPNYLCNFIIYYSGGCKLALTKAQPTIHGLHELSISVPTIISGTK